MKVSLGVLNNYELKRKCLPGTNALAYFLVVTDEGRKFNDFGTLSPHRGQPVGGGMESRMAPPAGSSPSSCPSSTSTTS